MHAATHVFPVINSSLYKHMDIEIRNKELHLNIYGFGGMAPGKDHAVVAFKLSGKLWEVIRGKGIKNKGMNIWVYEPGEKVFAGVELEDANADNDYGLEEKEIGLEKYAYCKHVGPYNLIKQTGQNMITELTKKGFEVVLPYIEIYGHWSANENELETELLMCVK
jgi:effector-binding domain-containing protein